jgi:hypothetical protein
VLNAVMRTVRTVVDPPSALVQGLVQDLVERRLPWVCGVIDPEESPCANDLVAGLENRNSSKPSGTLKKGIEGIAYICHLRHGQLNLGVI